MKKEFLNQLITKFDEYVNKFLQKKKAHQHTITPPLENKLNHYDQQMEKKLKLKPKLKQTNFEKLLAPMKGLNSFVSIRQILQGLGNEVFKPEADISKTVMGQKLIDLEPLDLKGVEMDKIEQYLTGQQFWQRRYNNCEFTQTTNENTFEQSDYKLWMEDTLHKICANKQGCGFNKKLKIVSNIHRPTKNMQSSLQAESYFKHSSIIRQNVRKKTQNQALNQHCQAFSKLSDVLTARLRRLLKTKSLGKTSKAIVINENSRIIKKKVKNLQMSSKTKTFFNTGTNLSYKSKFSQKQSKMMKTSQQWRNKINQRLKLIMADDGWGVSTKKSSKLQQNESDNQDLSKQK